MEEGRSFVPFIRKTWELPHDMVDKYRAVVERVCPKVSVIVASYNYADLITETLDSLMAQTYRNFEVIVVDDGSKDNSVEVIRQYVEKYPNIHLYMHEGGVNKGLPATVRLGIEKSTGRYVAFCESDDLWMPDHLEQKVSLVNEYGGRPKIIINDIQTFGDAKRCRAADGAIKERMQVLDKPRNRISALDFRKENWICTFSCCMVDREVIMSCDFRSCPRPANLDWWLWRQICCVNDLYVVRKKLTRWRMHESFMVNEKISSLLRQREFIGKMDELLVDMFPESAADIKPFVENARRYTFSDGQLMDSGVVSAVQPSFSVVMATYNRAFCICDAIDSLMSQTYQNFELVVIDDGSTDGTGGLLKKKYRAALKSGKIRYFHISNRGVCKARNAALGKVRNEWIAYLDSDNTLCPFFLETFVRAIVANPDVGNFYSRLICRTSRRVVGREFDLDALMRANFIDLGVYVHRRDYIDELGRFDENMTRLVDWELIVRQCKVHTPLFVDDITMLYNDSDGFDRITNSASLKRNMDYFRIKQCGWPIVTTVITTYNHKQYIKRALESAVMQKGDFVHEILVSDDGSTDGTRSVIRAVMEMYPGSITDISGVRNIGISGNVRKCFAAAKGSYIAMLEGDDYWISEWKLNRQLRFMRSHEKCSMCFSRIKILNPDGKFSLLARQHALKSELTGADFVRDPNQNLIANFSSCMFLASFVKNLPAAVYEERINEISVAFYMEQKGPIGFLPDIMSVYRLHEGGTWSMASRRKQLESAIRCREAALRLCAPEYRTGMNAAIERRRSELASLGDE